MFAGRRDCVIRHTLSILTHGTHSCTFFLLTSVEKFFSCHSVLPVKRTFILTAMYGELICVNILAVAVKIDLAINHRTSECLSLWWTLVDNFPIRLSKLWGTYRTSFWRCASHQSFPYIGILPECELIWSKKHVVNIPDRSSCHVTVSLGMIDGHFFPSFSVLWL